MCVCVCVCVWHVNHPREIVLVIAVGPCMSGYHTTLIQPHGSIYNFLYFTRAKQIMNG